MFIINFLKYLLWLLSWEKYRGLELFFLAVTSAGVFIAFVTYFKNSSRQRRIDKTSININPKNGQEGREGIFIIKNFGEIPHDIIIKKTILNDGNKIPITEEVKQLNYEKAFNGIILPHQSIDLHLFNIAAENLFVFRGCIKIIIDNKVIIKTKVRYAGEAADMIKNDFEYVHPLYRWTIYYQEILKI